MSAGAARGPLAFLLQSPGGQYILLGTGAYALFPEQVNRLLAPILSHPLVVARLGDWSDSLIPAPTAKNNSGMNAPIIIQTPSPTIIHGNGTRSWTTMIIYSVTGAGVCWIGYIVLSQVLPDAVSEFMPVTKRLFKQTSQTLGKGILQVKEILEDQVNQLMGQQKELEKKQNETHDSVKEVQKDLGEARNDLATLQSSLDRCEAGLDNTQNMQGYTLRGIKLLVRCVTSFLPDESNFIDDIAHYIEDGGPNDARAAGGPGRPVYQQLPAQQQQQQQQHHAAYFQQQRSLPMEEHVSTHRSASGTFMYAGNTNNTTNNSNNYNYNNNNGASPQIKAPMYMMSSSSSTPMQQARVTMVKPSNNNNNNSGSNYSEPPSITSIDSDDVSGAGAGNGGGSLGDIRALLGH